MVERDRLERREGARGVTYTPPTVAAPALLPLDAQTLADAALAIMRLEAADVDADRILEAAGVAIVLVSKELDYETAPATVEVSVSDAAVMLTVELYRRKDAPFGVTDSWTVDGASIRVSSDVMRGVRSQLAKSRSRWAVG